ncbi:mevalonate kinase-like isoform X2 [Tubulanus polymorphus]|uniref:mevalonate kinase-like isoform X2 n=1 Tax=Tubulanus polymorphus TaxID=672921 RepID=UPI003DA5B644
MMALAGSLNLRTSVRLKKSASTQLTAVFTDIGRLGISWPMNDAFIQLFNSHAGDPMKPCPPTDDVLKSLFQLMDIPMMCKDTHDLAVISFLYLYVGILGKLSDPPVLDIEVRSHLPTGAGLGSSAAYSTCLAGALLLYCGAIPQRPVSHDYNQSTVQWTKQELNLINSWSYQSEVILHKKPSGIDNSTSTYGGSLSFQLGDMMQLGNIPQIRILLTNTGVERSTKELVTNVFKRCENYVTVMEPILQAIDAISHRCQILLTDYSKTESNIEKIYCELQELVDINQHLLASLGVSHPSIDQICAVTKQYKLSTKLTGAGGGGCTLTLIPPEFPEDKLKCLIEQIKKLGCDCFDTVIGGLGVLQHHPDDWKYLTGALSY